MAANTEPELFFTVRIKANLKHKPHTSFGFKTEH